MSPELRRYVTVAVTVLLPTLALWTMLASQGARLGSAELPRLSYRFIAVAALLALWLACHLGPAERPSRRSKIVGATLAMTFLTLSVWRYETLAPPLDLVVTLEDGRTVPAATLQLPERRHVRRLTGQRRDVAFHGRALLEVPADGRYRFDLFCDDACTLDIGPHRLVARGQLSRTLELDRGTLPFRIDYVQTTGPAALLFSWDTPRRVELLPIEFYLRAEADAGSRRVAAVIALALLAAWWVGFSLALFDLAPLAASRWVPLVAAASIVLYGGALRVEAFLAHARLAETHEAAERWHARLLPLTPAYAVFNPENAPEDPYRADVRSYLDRAEAMRFPASFYAPSFREPLYVAVTKPFLAVAGGEIGILVQSLFFSILTLPLVYAAVYRQDGPLWALAVLMPVALHQWLVLEAPTGYRMSAYGFVLVAFVSAAALFRSPVATGLLGGALCLIRLSALSVVVPVLAVKLIGLAPEKRRRHAAVAGGLVTLLVAPFLWSNFRAHGDPLYSVSFHTEFWLRAEGLASEADGPVGVTQYFTDFGRGREVAKGTALGMTALPLRTFWNGLAQFPLLGLAVLTLGIVGLLTPHRLYLVAYLGQLLPFAYIQNFPSGEMPRFVMPAFLVLVLTLPQGGRSVARAATRLLRARTTRSV